MSHQQHELFVPGAPKPQGSKTYYGKGRPVESCKDLPQWRQAVAFFAAQAKPALTPRPDAVVVAFEFVMPRPAYLPKTRTPEHTKQPDLDKLVRAAGDALTGILWEDDAQIARYSACSKRYAEPGEATGMLVRWERRPR
jgi:crossover junction endodeoxyribonuclease RusA